MPTIDSLPPELLLKINEFFFIRDHQPVPQFYLRLALVNRRFQEVFMSDAVWRRLDVHCVGGGISLHYLGLKKRMSIAELEFCGAFDFDQWAHPYITLDQFHSLSLYTQASILAESQAPVNKNHLWEQIGNPDLLVYAARTANGLWFATAERKRDPIFMARLIGAGGTVVYHTCDALKDDRDFILKCTEGDRHVLRDCSPRLKGDKAVALAHFVRSAHHFSRASDELRDDFDVAMAAISKDPLNLVLCSKRLRNDRGLVTAAIKSDGVVLAFASAELKQDLEVVLTAVASNPRAFEFAHVSCQQKIIRSGASRLMSTSKRQRLP